MIYGIDMTYILLIIPALVLSMWAQLHVQKTYKSYSVIENKKRYTGADVARRILDINNLLNVSINRTGGKLTDNYNPKKKEINLSMDVYQSTSLAAIGVAAHEAGHAIQYKEKYQPLTIRKVLLPVASVGSSVGPWIIIGGILLTLPQLTTIGIILFSLAVLFYLITLPIEFNASKRAIDILSSSEILEDYEIIPVKRVLRAASLTYVASALTAILSLVRLLLLSRKRR